MDKIDEKYPQFIRIDETKKISFLDPLRTIPGTVFYKRELGEAYMMAAALGYKYKLREKSKKSIDLRLYQTLNEDYKLLIRIIVLSTEKYNYEILKEGIQTLKIVEEYVNGGVSLLYDKIANNDSSTQSIEEEIWTELKELGKDK